MNKFKKHRIILTVWYSFVLVMLAGVGFYGMTHGVWS